LQYQVKVKSSLQQKFVIGIIQTVTDSMAMSISLKNFKLRNLRFF